VQKRSDRSGTGNRLHRDPRVQWTLSLDVHCDHGPQQAAVAVSKRDSVAKHREITTAHTPLI